MSHSSRKIAPAIAGLHAAILRNLNLRKGKLRWGRWAAIALISLTLLLTHLQASSLGQTSGPQPTARGTGGAVASEQIQATQIGIEVLQAGGNAVDAAVATAAALGVVEPFAAGIGGGGFMVIALRDRNQVVTLDGREQAPLSVGVDLFRDPDNPDEILPFRPNRISNGAAVGVPGTLATWTEALKRYGTLSLQEVLEPAIALAEGGFEVDAVFAQQIEDNRERFEAFTSTRALFLSNGQPPSVGSRFRNPDLAKTYRLVAEQGEAVFYRGEIGEAIVETVQHPPTVSNPPFRVIPGGMIMEDLDLYHLRLRPAVMTDYHGYQVYGMGLPSSGGITSMQVLNLVEGFNLGALERSQALHTLIEAERLAYADRNAYLGDPEFVDVPVEGLLSDAYAHTRRQEMGDRASSDDSEVRAEPDNPLPYQTDPSPSMTGMRVVAETHSHLGASTTHLTVADRWGNVVSYTFTIEAIGGSGIVVPGYGFLLNNELTDFDAVSPHPNSPEPLKRPRSSIAPTFIQAPDGRVIAFGSPGGASIITTVLGLETNLMDFGMSLEDAIAAPRISQRNGGATEVDQGLERTDLGQALGALGHHLEPSAEIGAATGIVINPDGSMLAVAEPVRRGGGSAMVVEPK